MNLEPLPPPNPLWERSTPKESTSGRFVSIDLMAIYDQHAHNQVFGVKPVEPQK